MNIMNKKIIFSVLSLLVLFVTGCSDKFLEDKKNYDQFDETIFENETQCGWFVDRMYYDAFSGYKHPGWTMFGAYSEDRMRLTEEIGGYTTTGSTNWINPTLTYVDASNCPTYFGTSLSSSSNSPSYTRIRYYNLLIQKVDEKGASLSETFRKQAKGQMYFLRAWQYYDLLRTYGGVPIVTTVQNASVDPSIQLPRASTSAVVDQIISDLDLAASLLPAKWDAANYGRLTGDAALAMKSRVLLTFASPLFNQQWDNSSDVRWTDALNAGLAAEAQLTADGYGLYNPNPSDAVAKDWSDMFVKFDNTFCKEAIIVQLLSNTTSSTAGINNGWENSVRLKIQGGTGGVPAPKEMIDLFPMADGSRPTVANGYNDTKFFLNRDPRFYRTFAFNGCKWGTSANANATVWAYRFYKTDGKTKLYNDAMTEMPSSPAFVRKMSDPTADNTKFAYSGTDIFEYRYAELLLNIAECYAAVGNTTKCTEYLGKVRARAGIRQGTNNWGLGTFSDKHAAIAACLYERQVELAYEGKRFWDAQRWLLYDGVSTISTASNTCNALGIPHINGTHRTGNYWQTKVNANTDPIPSATKTSIVIDPDKSDFATQLNNLSTLFDTYFVRVATDNPMDAVNGSVANITFRPNYYIFGLPNSTLTNNSWLLQTKGWNDAFGKEGTFDYQE